MVCLPFYIKVERNHLSPQVDSRMERQALTWRRKPSITTSVSEPRTGHPLPSSEEQPGKWRLQRWLFKVVAGGGDRDPLSVYALGSNSLVGISSLPVHASKVTNGHQDVLAPLEGLWVNGTKNPRNKGREKHPGPVCPSSSSEFQKNNCDNYDQTSC